MVEDWGRAHPGMGLDLNLKGLVKSNLELVVSVFGLIAHAYLCGEMTFRTVEQEEEIAITLESLLKLCSSTGISPEEWDAAVREIQAVSIIQGIEDGVFDA